MVTRRSATGFWAGPWGGGGTVTVSLLYTDRPEKLTKLQLFSRLPEGRRRPGSEKKRGGRDIGGRDDRSGKGSNTSAERRGENHHLAGVSLSSLKPWGGNFFWGGATNGRQRPGAQGCRPRHYTSKGVTWLSCDHEAFVGGPEVRGLEGGKGNVDGRLERANRCLHEGHPNAASGQNRIPHRRREKKRIDWTASLETTRKRRRRRGDTGEGVKGS